MSWLVTRENQQSGGLDYGVGPPMRWGLVSPAAVQLGLGAVARMGQPDRLMVSQQAAGIENPLTWPVPRLQNPRSLDAGRILDFGAPAPRQVLEYAPMALAPTARPQHLQGLRAIGGRYVALT